MNVIRLHILFFLALVLSSPELARAATPSVVVSVAPLHAIAAAVMDGVALPRLLVKGNASPHDYALRPSDAAALDGAGLVLWIGQGFETFLAKPLEALAADAMIITLDDMVADGGDPHIWLDVDNARDIARRVADALRALDPDNGERYAANLSDFAHRLNTLDGKIRDILTSLAEKPYLVLHDAYGYFERRYGLSMVAAVTINPQQKPGAKRIRELRQLIDASGATCLFGEPQFTPAVLATLAEGNAVRIAVLDPLGATLTPGPEAYFTLMTNLAESLSDCLAMD